MHSNDKMAVLQCGMKMVTRNVNIFHPTWPHLILFLSLSRSLCNVIHAYCFACNGCYDNCYYVLFSNKITFLIELLMHQLTVGVGTYSCLPLMYFYGCLLSCLKAVCVNYATGSLHWELASSLQLCSFWKISHWFQASKYLYLMGGKIMWSSLSEIGWHCQSLPIYISVKRGTFNSKSPLGSSAINTHRCSSREKREGNITED